MQFYDKLLFLFVQLPRQEILLLTWNIRLKYYVLWIFSREPFLPLFDILQRIGCVFATNCNQFRNKCIFCKISTTSTQCLGVACLPAPQLSLSLPTSHILPITVHFHSSYRFTEYTVQIHQRKNGPHPAKTEVHGFTCQKPKLNCVKAKKKINNISFNKCQPIL